MHLGRRTRLGIAFWLQGNCILDKRFWASNCFCRPWIDFFAYILILPPVDWFLPPASGPSLPATEPPYWAKMKNRKKLATTNRAGRQLVLYRLLRLRFHDFFFGIIGVGVVVVVVGIWRTEAVVLRTDRPIKHYVETCC